MPTQNPEELETDDGDAKKSKDTNAMANLQNVPKNKVRSFRGLPIHEKTKNLIVGSSIIARSNLYEVPEHIEKQA